MPDEIDKTARTMVRQALKGALATLDADTGTPYASLILIATTVDGSPITLLSALARHTRNLSKAPSASILIDCSDPSGDTLSGGRVSLMGQFGRDPTPHTRARFLARHAAAATYVDFADFGFWRMQIESAHLIEGFGRIVTLPGPALSAPLTDPEAFAGAETACLAELRHVSPNVSGFDSEGVDLITDGRPTRLTFDAPHPLFANAFRAASKCLAAPNT